jgi:hypothetical protein
MFLNCTAHELTEEQRQKALEYSNILIDLKTYNPVLWEKLVNCPAEVEALKTLAQELLSFLKEVWLKSNQNLLVHFPIGSPAFQAIFFQKLDRKSLPIRILFSHSDRVSVDEIQPNGSVLKKGLFQFVKFLEI